MWIGSPGVALRDEAEFNPRGGAALPAGEVVLRDVALDRHDLEEPIAVAPLARARPDIVILSSVI
jgi:hypothetical protein